MNNIYRVYPRKNALIPNAQAWDCYVVAPTKGQAIGLVVRDPKNDEEYEVNGKHLVGYKYNDFGASLEVEDVEEETAVYWENSMLLMTYGLEFAE